MQSGLDLQADRRRARDTQALMQYEAIGFVRLSSQPGLWLVIRHLVAIAARLAWWKLAIIDRPTLIRESAPSLGYGLDRVQR